MKDYKDPTDALRWAALAYEVAALALLQCWNITGKFTHVGSKIKVLSYHAGEIKKPR